MLWALLVSAVAQIVAAPGYVWILVLTVLSRQFHLMDPSFEAYEGRGNFSTIPATTAIFPLLPSRISSGFTISPHVHLNRVAMTQFKDDVLDVHHKWDRSSRELVHVALNRWAWETEYKNGSINPAGEGICQLIHLSPTLNLRAVPGGFGFYMSGPKAWSSHLPVAKEVMFSYSVLFEEGFEWVKGGETLGWLIASNAH